MSPTVNSNKIKIDNLILTDRSSTSTAVLEKNVLRGSFTSLSCCQRTESRHNKNVEINSDPSHRA